MSYGNRDSFSRVFNGVWDATGRVLRNSTVEMRESAGRPESSLRSGEGEVITKGANGEPVERYSAIAGVTGDLEKGCPTGQGTASAW